MKLPPHGICLPCRVRRVVDGDTIDVSLAWSDAIWRIRLLECWVADKTESDARARALIEDLTSRARQTSVFIPIGQGEAHVSELLTLDRVLGRVFANDMDLSAHLVSMGLATATKPANRKPRSVSKDDA